MKKGFSLIELLVVISIIGILIAAGSAAFINAQQNARDAKRRSDIKAMQSAFEQYYATNGTYETPCSSMVGSALPAGLPTDPQSGNTYSCLSDADSYCTCAQIENPGKGNATGTGTANSCSFGAGDWFCQQNLQ